MNRYGCDPDNPGVGGLSNRQAFGLAFAVISGHAACFWVFTRKNFGGRAFTLCGPLALVIMLLYGAYSPCPEITYFGVVWFALLVAHRVIYLVGAWKGRRVHSLDDGEPWLVRAILRPVPGDFMAKAFWEPLLALGAGALLRPYCENLGYFVMSGAVSLAARRLIERAAANAELQEMHDHEIEMRARMARYRGL